MARIKKHRGKWQVLFRDAEGRERSAGTYTFKSDAQKRKVQVERERELGTFVDPALSAYSFASWTETWLSSQVGLRLTTQAFYESLLRSRILPRFGGSRLRDIRPIDIQEWVSALDADGLSASRIRQAHRLLSSILRVAVRNRMLPFNPAEGLALPKASHREMLFLTAPAVDRLADVIDPRYRSWVYLQAYGGLRWGEAAALRRSRVNLLRKRIEVAESVAEVSGLISFGETKNRRRRTIVVPSFLNAMLAEHLSEAVDAFPDALVFTAPQGGVLRNSNFKRDVWKPAVFAADLPGLRVHDLRHTCAALLIQQGAHPIAAMRHLGHSSIKVTMDRYGHLMPAEAERIADGLNETYRELQEVRSAAL